MRLESAAPAEAPSLDHIPGDYGLPVVGNTLHVLSDPLALVKRNFGRYGPVFKGRSFFIKTVTVVGPEAAQQVFQDKGANFSSRLGWHNNLGHLFPGALMLRDFDDHRFHRRLVQPAFKQDALTAYARQIGEMICGALAAQSAGAIRFYPFAKALLLKLGVGVFFGSAIDARRGAEVNRAISAMTAAAATLNRAAIPGSRAWRGLRGRKYLEQFIRDVMRAKRGTQRTDMLAQLCAAMEGAGGRLTEQDVVDHMIFIIMASHDTVASSATNLVHLLARHPQWQERIRAESGELGAREHPYESISGLQSLGLAFKESLRLYPPIPAIPRRALQECEIGGFRIPANTPIWVHPMLNHRLEKWWNEPDEFDPQRFAEPRAEDRQHPFLWIPFGAGAHTCIGLHLGGLIVKLFVHQLVSRFTVKTIRRDSPRYRMFPFPHPADGLPLLLAKRTGSG